MPDSSDVSTITVRMVYLARLREAFGTAHEDLVLRCAKERATVADAIEALSTRGGAWAVELAKGRAVRAAVNHAMVGRDAVVRAGDEVALFPPVTGG